LNGASYHSLLSLSEITLGYEVINLVIITAIFIVIGLLTTVIGLPVVLAPLAGLCRGNRLASAHCSDAASGGYLGDVLPLPKFSDRDWNAI
jgi:hypothetical protein